CNTYLFEGCHPFSLQEGAYIPARRGKMPPSPSPWLISYRNLMILLIILLFFMWHYYCFGPIYPHENHTQLHLARMMHMRITAV
ncbi:MAG: hypothetical protein M0R18_15340, partial [Deltaproteobacteria bacterium]|nr:hypothetical protein [Deltaproteobacteria bacterium]